MTKVFRFKLLLVFVMTISVGMALGLYLYFTQINRSFRVGIEYTGRVVDLDKAGISGVNVTAIGESGKCYGSATDTNGNFSFRLLEDWKYIIADREGMEFMYLDKYSPKNSVDNHRFVGWSIGRPLLVRHHEVGQIFAIGEASRIKLREGLSLMFSGIGTEELEIEIEGAAVALRGGDSRSLMSPTPQDYYENLVLDRDQLEVVNKVFFNKGQKTGWVNFSVRKRAGVLVIDWAEHEDTAEYILYPAHAFKGFYNELIIDGRAAFDSYRGVYDISCS